ncbi:hypothetical protein CF139_05080 [Aeromonas hydrophila]|uniref:hypothetical protein n=1 Tax=Aeromonas hydrophila TaxID=644 RepID=UPI00111632DF|nr:hypothetical protein [Aeromonas hydrophila]TNH91152.1 hypothetical protein CF139_05080 [Aeromonas hydrophila]
MAYPVKWYASQMQGAPSLGDTTDGALAALLKAVLVTGFGQLTITGLSWDATEGAAVATVQSGHKYLQDSVALIEGVSPAAYNGEHRIKKVDTTRVWFELDGGNPGAAGSGAAMTIKVAPLGWTLTHESADGKVAIYRPTDISASGNVSLRVDNSAFSGWFGANYHAYLAKVAMVEDVVDINTYTTIYEHRWPATKRFSDGRWDFIGDSQLFYFIPAYAAGNAQFVYSFGYIKSVRPGDRYHCIMNHYPSTNAEEQARWWDQPNSNYASWGNNFPTLSNSAYRVLARPYTQLFGVVNWWNIGLFTRIGAGLNVPNAPDNGFYLSTDPLMVLENGSHLRGYMPGLVAPFATIPSWDRKNFANLPAIPGKILRFLRVGHDESQYNQAITMISFDLTGPWR